MRLINACTGRLLAQASDISVPDSVSKPYSLVIHNHETAAELFIRNHIHQSAQAFVKVADRGLVGDGGD